MTANEDKEFLPEKEKKKKKSFNILGVMQSGTSSSHINNRSYHKFN